MSSYFWVKLHLKYLTDATFNTSLNDAQKWRYMQLYMLAKELNAGGAFLRNNDVMSLEDIAWILHLDAAQLADDINTLTNAGLIAANGHGPYLTRYSQEQAPISDADRKEAQRERERDQALSRGNHEIVTARDTESESESDKDLESANKESDGEESSSSVTAGEEEGDPLSKQKAIICQLSGILKKNQPDLISNALIIPDDILAELARNYARHRSDPKEVKNPGAVSGMNLARGERAAIEWYETDTWLDYIPRPLLQAVRPDLLKEQSETKNPIADSDYTKYSTETETAMDIPINGHSPNDVWKALIADWDRDGTARSLLRICKNARPADFAEGLFTIVVPNTKDCETLESRLADRIDRLLPGFFGFPVKVQFVTQEPHAT